LYHTQKDIPELLDFESIQAFTEYALHSAMQFSNSILLPLDLMTLIESIGDIIDGFGKIESNPFEFQAVSDLLTKILEYKDALKRFSLETEASGVRNDISRLNDFLLRAAGNLNRTLGRVRASHEANYLARLEMIQDYVKIDSVLRELEEMPFMKIHPRILAGVKELDDFPYKLVDAAGSILELRMECDKLALQINEEIENITSSLRDTLTEITELLA
jgi:hypothetical protein